MMGTGLLLKGDPLVYPRAPVETRFSRSPATLSEFAQTCHGSGCNTARIWVWWGRKRRGAAFK
ncbi:hypothetical protein AZA_42720 [Nitrospirillum viridazoti Y2]|nr:hypothetical protein AZA_42720 [Nitrospirillum amazonense Y2]